MGRAEPLLLIYARCDALPPGAEAWYGSLAREERARAARFRREADRTRHLLGAALVRQVLGRLTGVPPAEVPVRRGPSGKLGLAAGPAFNLAHSGPWVVLAVAAGGRVGVDVEVWRPVARLEGLALRVLDERERAALLAEPPGVPRVQAFLRAWTRKEAVVKALGAGLGHPLEHVSVSLARDPGPSALLGTARLGEDAASWTVRPVALAPEGVEAAVAWDRPPASVRLTRFEAGAWLAGPHGPPDTGFFSLIAPLVRF